MMMMMMMFFNRFLCMVLTDTTNFLLETIRKIDGTLTGTTSSELKEIRSNGYEGVLHTP